MDPQMQRLLELTEENNQMLKKLRRAQKIASIMRILYWLVIVGATIGAFYVFQPYINQIQEMWQGISGSFEQLKDFKQ